MIVWNNESIAMAQNLSNSAQGLQSIFEYINQDGALCETNCGLAAAATFLTHLGLVPNPGPVMDWLERFYPPDIVFGFFGTSRRRVEQICRRFDIRLRSIQGEESLKRELDACRPVMVMLAVPAGQFAGFDLPGGHWMVAYGYDAERVYLTNWGSMTWDEFRKGWNGTIPRLIQMRNRGLVERDDRS